MPYFSLPSISLRLVARRPTNRSNNELQLRMENGPWIVQHLLDGLWKLASWRAKLRQATVSRVLLGTHRAQELWMEWHTMWRAKMLRVWDQRTLMLWIIMELLYFDLQWLSQARSVPRCGLDIYVNCIVVAVFKTTDSIVFGGSRSLRRNYTFSRTLNSELRSWVMRMFDPKPAAYIMTVYKCDATLS